MGRPTIVSCTAPSFRRQQVNILLLLGAALLTLGLEELWKVTTFPVSLLKRRKNALSKQSIFNDDDDGLLARRRCGQALSSSSSSPPVLLHTPIDRWAQQSRWSKSNARVKKRNDQVIKKESPHTHNKPQQQQLLWFIFLRREPSSSSSRSEEEEERTTTTSQKASGGEIRLSTARPQLSARCPGTDG